MSEMIQANQPGLLQHLKMQIQGFIQQREAAKQQHEQLQGAIFACEQIIEKIEKDAKEQLANLAKKIQEDKESDEPNDQEPGESPQE